MTPERKIRFDIYGLFFSIEGSSVAAEKIGRDFSYFRIERLPAETGKLFRIKVHEMEPPWDALPEDTSPVLTHPEFVQYKKSGIKYTDYNGRGVSIYEPMRGRVCVYSTDPEFLHEIGYLAVHSISGDELEKRGFYRVHALAFSYARTGVILLAPSGGGKTSLFLEMLRDSNVKMLSDDVALIDKKLNIHPFPLRVGAAGIVPEAEGVSPEHIYSIKRRKYPSKDLIDIKAFRGRISGPVRARILISARRWNSGKFICGKAGFFSSGAELFKNLVVGLGLPQVLEYMNVRVDMKSAGKLFGKASGRLSILAGLLLRCRLYRVYLGRDRKVNRRGIIGIIKETSSGGV